MIMHGLLYWGSYAHPLIPPVPLQSSLYFPFLLFTRSLSVFIPLIWHCVVIFISSLYIFTSPTYINPRLCRPGPPRKRASRWRTAHPDWMDIYFHCLNEQNIGAGRRGAYAQDPFVIVWTSLWVDARRILIMINFETTKPLTS